MLLCEGAVLARSSLVDPSSDDTRALEQGQGTSQEGKMPLQDHIPHLRGLGLCPRHTLLPLLTSQSLANLL
eukprot:12922805-Prorocentrum_lima.AAC.1